MAARKEQPSLLSKETKEAKKGFRKRIFFKASGSINEIESADQGDV